MTERALLERLRGGERNAAGVAFERYGRLDAVTITNNPYPEPPERPAP